MKIERPNPKQKMPYDANMVFKGVVFDVYQWEQKQFDGSFKTFEKLRRNDAVSIIPIIDDGTIMIIEEEQPGKEKYFGFPGGEIIVGEDVLDAAKREFLEETGYVAKNLILFDSRQVFGKIDEAVYTFIAKGCKKVKEQNLDSGERVKVRFISAEDLLKWILLGKIRLYNKDLIYIILKSVLNEDDFSLNLKKFKELLLL